MNGTAKKRKGVDGARLRTLSHQPVSRLQQQHQSSSVSSARTAYTSIVSELFEGSLISQVECLECGHISTTTESFLHLSLPIPSREYLQALHARLANKHAYMHQSSSSAQLSDSSSSSSSSSSPPVAVAQQQQGWLGWLVDTMKSLVWSQTIKLADCLTAFFSDDDLKDDNMYSCDKCKK